jgi:hypothetical protein
LIQQQVSQKDISVCFVGVGDGVDSRAGFAGEIVVRVGVDGFDEVAVGLITVNKIPEV